MGIQITAVTTAKAALKLYKQIASYIYEQSCGELEGEDEVKAALKAANKALADLMTRNQ
jgi:hypothetical protein